MWVDNVNDDDWETPYDLTPDPVADIVLVLLAIATVTAIAVGLL